ncbi:hypothetical protein IYQ_13688 [Aeromonas salmonicida subsp. salmonicida 01-B526]|uniref:Uncharacterized protein n=1 Tax=Aeromonas salmonicida subsp. salmonicida 01-B526 TaxID=1076135 RepID=A0ABN0DYK7_AERSS|nr:hypothetical protein IYQ_13688 [Aeromonas salmonicida subsp. salmonicida 01-B526]
MNAPAARSGAAILRLQRLVREAQQQGIAAARLENFVVERGGDRASRRATETMRCMALRLLM